MQDDKYNRNVAMLCPTCGCSQFEYEKAVDETIELVKCASCGRSLTKDELLSENRENIDEHFKEIADEAKKDIAKELKES